MAEHPVNGPFCPTNFSWKAPPMLSVVVNYNIFSGWEWKIHSEIWGKEWKTISIGCCFPPKFTNSRTLIVGTISVSILIKCFWNSDTNNFQLWGIAGVGPCRKETCKVWKWTECDSVPAPMHVPILAEWFGGWYVAWCSPNPDILLSKRCDLSLGKIL